MHMIFYIFQAFLEGHLFFYIVPSIFRRLLIFLHFAGHFVGSATHLEIRTQGTPSMSPVIRASEG